MPILHIVLFEFKPTTTHAQVEEACKNMMALPEICTHPTTKARYVKTHGGGRDTSPEGLQGAFTHAFIHEFASEADRAYYLEQDPAHLAFGRSLAGIIENMRVLDFEPGKF
ncbi:hypothetical protein LTR08_004308 [Meristemomyces frigidus]|nr:hypothetical protein LTR08_004308 [Meristemomyces frigidus]